MQQHHALQQPQQRRHPLSSLWQTLAGMVICLTWAMWLTAVLSAEGCMLFHSCTRRLDLLLTSFARPSNTPLHNLLHHWHAWQGPPK